MKIINNTANESEQNKSPKKKIEKGEGGGFVRNKIRNWKATKAAKAEALKKEYPIGSFFQHRIGGDRYSHKVTNHKLVEQGMLILGGVCIKRDRKGCWRAVKFNNRGKCVFTHRAKYARLCTYNFCGNEDPGTYLDPHF